MPTLGLLTLALACTSKSPDDSAARDYTEYRRFTISLDADNALAAYEEMVTMAEEATPENAALYFDEAETAYNEYGLDDRVVALQDPHLETSGFGHAGLGVFLGAGIRAALSNGRAAEDERAILRSAELIDKLMLEYFYFATYQGVAARSRATLDEGFVYAGLEPDGTPAIGLALKAAGREEEFGVTLVAPMFTAFVDANYELRDGTSADDEVMGENAAYDAAMATIDRELARTLGYYAMHEIDELDEDPAIKLLEARVVWDGIEPMMLQLDPTLAGQVIGALYPNGQPAREIGYFEVDLEEVESGALVVDGGAVRQGIGQLLAILEG